MELLSSFCLASVPNPWNTRTKQKRKLLLAEDGTVYKVKRSKMENNVEAGQYVLYTVYLYYIVVFYNK